MKRYIAIAVLASVSSFAQAAEVIIHTMSIHYSPNERQNNANVGIGYRADTPCFDSERFKNNILVGVYHNTYYNPSVYGGCYVNLYEFKSVEIGAMGGLITGYDHIVTPGALGIITYHFNDKWNAKASFAPVANGVINFSMGYQF